MKKVVDKTVRTEIRTCDLCDQKMGDKRYCHVCHREVCYACGRLMFVARGGSFDLIELPLCVCKECVKHSQIIEVIQAALDGANNKVRQWLDTWREAAKAGVNPPVPEIAVDKQPATRQDCER